MTKFPKIKLYYEERIDPLTHSRPMYFVEKNIFIPVIFV